MNTVNIIGNIGNVLEVMKTANGKSVVKVNVAVRRNAEVTDWFNCVAYNLTAEKIAQYFSQGDPIGITGQLYTEQYEKDGKKLSYTKIFINEFTFAGDTKKKKEPEYNGILKTKPVVKEEPKKTDFKLDDVELDITSDDLPF